MWRLLICYLENMTYTLYLPMVLAWFLQHCSLQKLHFNTTSKVVQPLFSKPLKKDNKKAS